MRKIVHDADAKTTLLGIAGVYERLADTTEALLRINSRIQDRPDA